MPLSPSSGLAPAPRLHRRARLVVLLAAPANVPVTVPVTDQAIEPVEIAMPEAPADADEAPVPAAAPVAAKPPTPQAPARRRSKSPDDPDRLEWSVLPATAYDIDLGLGFGAQVTLAQFEPGYQPYRWRLEILANARVKRVSGVGATFPVHDDYIRADVPGLVQGRLRIQAQLQFRRFANQGWYGLGNASPALEPWRAIDPERDPDRFAAARRYHQYDRIYPQIDLNQRILVWDSPVAGPPVARSRARPGLVPAHKRRLEVLVGASFAYNFIRPYPDSKLAEDLAVRETDTADGETLRELVHGVDDHAVATLNLGLLYDTRDHEFVPTHGSFSELSTRLSPGVDDGLTFAQIFVSTAHYQPLAGEHLVVASRVAFDWLFGRPPLYELAQFGVLVRRDGPGGSWSIRGVPRQRYFGKQKAIANLELRSMFARFDIRSQRFGVGALAFVDAGRVWTDHRPVTLAGVDVDGNFAEFPGGIKVGVGAGLRLTWGETLVVRIDPAWSPTEQNFGLYLDIGQMF